ncbi:hypothetical protein [Streptomyces mangrovi]|uniref:hypothetical protein n=1 Tax=Streptomyces mangrovi TaxID=1206892 RepID=UPI00399CC102
MIPSPLASSPVVYGPPPLPGPADPRAAREFRDALLDARAGRRPAVPLLARLRRALPARRREPC